MWIKTVTRMNMIQLKTILSKLLSIRDLDLLRGNSYCFCKYRKIRFCNLSLEDYIYV